MLIEVQYSGYLTNDPLFANKRRQSFTDRYLTVDYDTVRPRYRNRTP